MLDKGIQGGCDYTLVSPLYKDGDDDDDFRYVDDDDFKKGDGACRFRDLAI